MSDREITAELKIEMLSGNGARRIPILLARVTLGAKTDLGRVRDNNEDKFEWIEPEAPDALGARGRLYAVADGMGGHEAGQIASEMALKTAIRSYYASSEGEPTEALLDAIHAANSLVWEAAHRIPGRAGMGTTLTMLVLHEDRSYFGHIGDSRAYRLRDGDFAQITDDHSWVAEQVRAGSLTPEEASSSPYRNVITRSIGAEPEASPELYEDRIRKGDCFLLCSDGLSNVVHPEEMQEVLESESPSMAAWRLIDLANDRGGPDNITCLIVRIDGIEPCESAASTDSGEAAPIEPLPETDSLPKSNLNNEEPPRRRGWLGLRR